ncbi:EAL domain-containing protein [Myxosarcina sp. GI1]|uniref:sensor domain-containing protein n=1 Tax=Myxosarcina sp. GI1 TaxID=1541065 RepID=UPI00068D1F88|nr:EAL domain-containing protein [Myxosarcina sp. GI1]
MRSPNQFQFDLKLSQAVLNTFSTQIAIVDRTGYITAINQPWKTNRELSLLNRDAVVGDSYFSLWLKNVAKDSDRSCINSLDRAIAEILNRQRNDFKLEYVYGNGSNKNWFSIHLEKFQDADSPKVMIAQTKITEYKQMESCLRSIAEGTAAATGNEFFYSLVYHLTRALGVNYALVTECLRGDIPMVRTLAFWCKDDFGQNYEYKLAHTPCQRVINGLPCHYPRNIQKIFPQDADFAKFNAESYVGVPLLNSSGQVLGHLAIISENPIEDGSLELAILKIFASRAAAELERKRVEEQLIHDALHDSLTGLPNRSLFSDHLTHALKKYRRNSNDKFAVLFLDLDRFKVINDSLGHTFGDLLLVTISQRIQAYLRESDILARLGGDEFAILIDDIECISNATRLAERIQASLKLPFCLGTHEVFTSVSIGIAISDSSSDSAEKLLRNADIAMYKAKALGKTRYELFNDTLHVQVVNRLQLETDFRRALDRGEIKLYYQPIISLSDNKVKGFEALARWQHPQKGLVCPGDFIPLAEETGAIVTLGWWILQEACYQLREWQVSFNNPALTMGVNFSQKQLSQPFMTESLVQILETTGLAADSLRLEITESMLMDNTEATMKTLEQLRALGVQLDLDDFGTGYSSLSYLRSLPIDALKIDRSFVQNLDRKDKNNKIVEAIVMMAKSLGLKVIAEGIETEKQLAALRGLQCVYGQGYLFSCPLHHQSLKLWLDRWNY